MRSDREHILQEIKRLADTSGKAPGRLAFARATEIKEHDWSGVFWSKWSDALAEAGCERNALQSRFATTDVLALIVEACRHYGHVPSSAELRMYRQINPRFPSHNTISNHFHTRRELFKGLAEYCAGVEMLRDVLLMLPDKLEASEIRPSSSINRQAEGFVYLLKSGSHYKIGRSDEIERRVKEIRVSLPETLSLVHTVRTDDPAGIEAYWHRRFADLRANGEWFKLGSQEVAAFKKRKYQ